MTPKGARERPPLSDPERSASASAIPRRIRRKVAPWIDVGEVGAAGFWDWFEAMLPSLGSPGASPPSVNPELELAARVRELARDLTDCSADRARLITECDRYYRDNRVLSVRVKALEATLATQRERGRSIADPGDPEAERAAERYLPPR